MSEFTNPVPVPPAQVSADINSGGNQQPSGASLKAAAIRASVKFVDVLRADGHRLTKSVKSHSCCCPFHHDRTPSFVVFNDGRAKCFGCDWHGDVIHYVCRRDNTDFIGAVEWLEAFADQRGVRVNPTPEPEAPSIVAVSPLEAKKRIDQYCSRLAQEDHLQQKVAAARGWNPYTIKDLASFRYLGWAGDSLAFIYGDAVKLRRWPGRDFKWEFGSPSLWRRERLTSAREVYLTEGETDAISLIDSGKEKLLGHVVVAVPSATTFNPAWAAEFSKKIVTLCFDGDEAGQKAAARIGAMIAPYAFKVFNFNPKEALQ